MGTKSSFYYKSESSKSLYHQKIGGAKRDRTADLNTASVALSQLSYGPSTAAYIKDRPLGRQPFFQRFFSFVNIPVLVAY